MYLIGPILLRAVAHANTSAARRAYRNRSTSRVASTRARHRSGPSERTLAMALASAAVGIALALLL